MDLNSVSVNFSVFGKNSISVLKLSDVPVLRYKMKENSYGGGFL